MSSIALGMFSDVVSSLETGDKTNLETISNRDAEINRQYFLLVRLIRSTIMDTRLAGFLILKILIFLIIELLQIHLKLLEILLLNYLNL